MSSGADRAPESMVEEALGRLARGERPGVEQARRLAADREALARLSERDPLALFGLLGVLPPSEGVPAPPRMAARRGGLGRRGVLLAAAAGLAAAALVGVFGRVSGSPTPRQIDQVVLRVDSRTAQVIMLVPPDEGGPTVTLIVEEELDL